MHTLIHKYTYVRTHYTHTCRHISQPTLGHWAGSHGTDMYVYMYICMYICTYVHIHTYVRSTAPDAHPHAQVGSCQVHRHRPRRDGRLWPESRGLCTVPSVLQLPPRGTAAVRVAGRRGRCVGKSGWNRCTFDCQVSLRQARPLSFRRASPPSRTKPQTGMPVVLFELLAANHDASELLVSAGPGA